MNGPMSNTGMINNGHPAQNTCITRPQERPRAMTSERSSAPSRRTFRRAGAPQQRPNPRSKPPLRVLLTNVFGLCSKFSEFALTLRTSDTDVAIVTETKLTHEKMSITESTIDGYHPPIRLDRSAQGGGVAVWVKANLVYEHLSMIDCGNHEIIWLTVNLQCRKKMVIGALYRPGSASGYDVSLLQHLDSCLDATRSYGSSILLAGDFNVHNENWLGSSKTTRAGEYLEELCAAHGLHQHVETATRGANPLDLILSDLGDSVRVDVTSPIGSSDHSVLLASIPTCPHRERRTSRQVWRYNKADWGRLNNFFRMTDWNHCLQGNPEDACIRVTTKILEGMDQFIPSKKLITRPSDPSWWTPECTAAVRAKQHCWKRHRTHPSMQNEQKYKESSANCAATIKCAKSLESIRLRQKLSTGSMSSKEWWSTVKRAGGHGRQRGIPAIRDEAGNEHSTTQEIATCFGRFFADKCSLGESGDFNDADVPLFPNRCTTTIRNIRFRPATVERLLRQLDPAKATGPDGVPARVLRHCSAALASPLSVLFSLCFRHGIQPAMWKTASVVPVHKKQSRSALKNYRPVSLLSVVSKVMEKIVNKSLMNHMEKRNLLSAHQFGFRSGLGAADLLTSMNHEWLKSLNSGGAVRVLAVDIAGAFDKVSHYGVLHKLKSYGISGDLHRWLSNYLTDRNLQVTVGGATSPRFPITAGVPQGSILGPTLFLVYVNDAADVLPAGVCPATYADDTTIYSKLSSAKDAAEECQSFQVGVTALATWGKTWRVKFEPSKSQAMTISRHRLAWHIPQVQFNGLLVDEVNSLKLLGVVFDRYLSYGPHLHSTAIRASQRIGFLRKASGVLTLQGKITAYKGFVRPVMEYCPLVWLGAAPCHLSRLHRVQKRALSLIGPGISIDSLAIRRTISGFCVLYKLLCGPRLPTLQSLLPPPLAPLAYTRTRRQSLPTHDSQLAMALPPRSLDSIRRSFPYGMITDWNSIPPNIIGGNPCLRKLQCFKAKIYKHLKLSRWQWASDCL